MPLSWLRYPGQSRSSTSSRGRTILTFWNFRKTLGSERSPTRKILSCFDSRVALGAVSKGRSSSRMVNLRLWLLAFHCLSACSGSPRAFNKLSTQKVERRTSEVACSAPSCDQRTSAPPKNRPRRKFLMIWETATTDETTPTQSKSESRLVAPTPPGHGGRHRAASWAKAGSSSSRRLTSCQCPGHHRLNLPPSIHRISKFL